MGSNIDTVPHCPRCGYDLSGEAARWTVACPLHGTCSECGLEYESVDVMRPQRNRLPGFVEHERGPLALVVSAWRTWLWTINPAFFWRHVRLEYPPRVGRIGLWVVLTLGVVRLVPALIAGLGSVRYLPGWGTEGIVEEFVTSFGEGILPPFASPEFDYHLPAGLVLWAGGCVMFPVVLLCLPFTRSQSKVHTSHVLRSAVYSLSPFIVLSIPIAIALVARWIAIAIDGLPTSWSRGASTRTAHLIDNAARAAWTQLWVLGVPWIALWWYETLAVGWRLKRPLAVWVALVICALLAGLIGMALLDPMTLDGVLELTGS